MPIKETDEKILLEMQAEKLEPLKNEKGFEAQLNEDRQTDYYEPQYNCNFPFDLSDY